MSEFTRPSDHVKTAGADRRRQELAEMKAGPRLDGDRIIVPSYQYNAAAAEFWSLHSFRWFPTSKTWERSTSKPYNNKLYRPECWLESTRREFYKFWPTLAEHGPAQVEAAIETITTKYTQVPLDERHHGGNWR